MNIIKSPLSTEKSIRLMESDNTLIFVVGKKATKEAIKNEIQDFFKVKVVAVRTMIGPDARKRAYIRFANDTPAIDVATKLGLI